MSTTFIYKTYETCVCILSKRGHLSSAWLPRWLRLVGYSYSEKQSNILDTINLPKDLGLYPRDNKSVTTHIQIIQHLGFVLNFIGMTVFMPEAKITKLTEMARTILSKTVVVILLFAKLLGHIVSCFPAVEFGELFYRQVEIDKSTALKAAKWNFDADMDADRAKSDIQW